MRIIKTFQQIPKKRKNPQKKEKEAEIRGAAVKAASNRKSTKRIEGMRKKNKIKMKYME